MHEGRAVRTQYGALPYRTMGDGTLEILLVTSRQTRRWILPKGWPIKGLKPSKSAAREAYEEAGVVGKVRSRVIGTYRYEKQRHDEDGPIVCEVSIYPLAVSQNLEVFPEASERDLRWVGAAEALSMIDDEGLREVVSAFVGSRQAR